MRRYTAAEARKRFADVLNAAERGDDVVIERRGRRFIVQADRSAPRRTPRRKPIFEYIDPAVMKGEWTWTWTRKGLRFTPRSRSR